MSEVMIDLETLSVRPHAIILVIGAIKFNRNSPIWKENPEFKKHNIFYRKIEIKSCEDVGLHRNPETELWWDSQDKDVKQEAFGGIDRISLKQALEKFTRWFRGSKCVWGHGSSFDITILGEAYKRCDMEIPWKFWLVRDTRTLFDLGNVKMSDLPTYNQHHALYDCYRQILGVQKSLKHIFKVVEPNIKS